MADSNGMPTAVKVCISDPEGNVLSQIVVHGNSVKAFEQDRFTALANDLQSYIENRYFTEDDN